MKKIHLGTTIKAKVILLFAVFISPTGAKILSFSIGGVKMSPYRFTIILSLLCVFALKKIKIYLKGNKYSVSFMLFWFIYALISFFWALDVSGWIKSIFFLFTGVATMLLCINYFSSTDDIINAFFALCYGIAIQSFIGWYEIITRNYLFLEQSQENLNYYILGIQRIPIAMMGNPNDFATLMYFGFFIAILCFIKSNKKVTKVFHLSLAINYSVLLVMTTSRANILGLAMGVIMMALLFEKKKAFIVLLFITIVFFIPGSMTFISNQLHFDFNATSGSDVVRLGLIKTGRDYLFMTYGFGVGSGQIESWIQTIGSDYYVGHITNMHNWWMEIITAYGVFVFLGYLVFYSNIFVKNLKIWRECKNNTNAVSMIICCIMTGFVIASISSSSNMSMEWLWMFWSICIAYEGISSTDKIEKDYE